MREKTTNYLPNIKFFLFRVDFNVPLPDCTIIISISVSSVDDSNAQFIDPLKMKVFKSKQTTSRTDVPLRNQYLNIKKKQQIKKIKIEFWVQTFPLSWKNFPQFAYSIIIKKDARKLDESRYARGLQSHFK